MDNGRGTMAMAMAMAMAMEHQSIRELEQIKAEKRITKAWLACLLAC